MSSSSSSHILKSVATIIVAVIAFSVAGPCMAGGLFGELFAMPRTEVIDDEVDPDVKPSIQDIDPKDTNALRSALEDADPLPIPSQQIDLCDLTGDNCKSQVTDAEGYYQFDDIESGTYALQTLGSDGKLLRSQITLQENVFKELQILAK